MLTVTVTVTVVGPLTTYMGKCPDTPDKCDPNSLKWFKVDAKALKEDGKTWYHGDLGARGLFLVLIC